MFKKETLYGVEPRLDDRGWDVSAVSFHKLIQALTQRCYEQGEV